MRYLSTISAIAFLAATAPACAQTANNLAVLQGLAPFSALLNTAAGKAALDGNYKVTGAIQTGTEKQPGLEPFAAQQARALRDAYITFGNGTELADGLGSTLGGAYQAAAPATIAKGKDGKPKPVFTNISPAIGNLLVYSVISAELDANAAKYVFADGTYQPGKPPAVPASAAAMAFITAVDGKTDVMGKAYHLPAGSNGADPLGDSRPFQTEKTFVSYADPDYFGIPSSNTEWLDGAVPGTKSMGMKLLTSPSFPSGHTTYGYTEGLLLGIMVPARYTQQITRAAEYGNNRIVVGAHYAMDVLGGRTVALYDLAQLLSENPAYLNQKLPKSQPIGNYADALKLAQADLTKALETSTGKTIAAAAQDDTSRFANPSANEAFYESTQTYSLPVVYPAQAAAPEDVAKIAPEAGHLLTAAFPYLTLKQADDILTATEGPGGGFLDNGSHFGLYSRLDLYKAGLQAAADAPKS
jgi:hypothetical protein